MACDRCKFYFSFWAIFCSFNVKKKMKTTAGDIIILHVYQKVLSDDVWFLRNGARQMVGQTDEKSDIRGGCPN